MYPGWISTGTGNPLTTGGWQEVVNNARAYAYARNSGLCWLEECMDCPETQTVTPGTPPDGYQSPIVDPAPWFDADNPDTWGFLGVIGLEVQGDEHSTRQVTVTNAITYGGVIGPPYFGPRTLVVRALAIAEDECSLQAGLDWLRFSSGRVTEPCVGDSMTYFDCCPCVCDDSGQSAPCWVEQYRELRLDPDDCNPGWWPDTYKELKDGPTAPADLLEWCDWVNRYSELMSGPPTWSCCVNECVTPYLRQFHNTMLTEGPTILQHPQMNSRGALAEVEFTFVAADPAEYALYTTTGVLTVAGGMRVLGSGGSAGAMYDPDFTPPPDPFAPARSTMVLERPKPRLADPEAGWLRDTIETMPPLYGNVLSAERLTVRLRAGDAEAGRVRIGVWIGEERLGGWHVPLIPARSMLEIDGARRMVTAWHDGDERTLRGFVKDWDGSPARFPNLPHACYRVTIDQEAGKAVELQVTAGVTPVGGA